VFLAPAKQGRLVEATAEKAARFRDAVMLPDGKSLIALSTESGEVELWKIPANGVGEGERLTTDGSVLRWEAIPSPDGKWVAHQDKNNQLWLLDLTTKANKKIATAEPTGNSSPAFEGVAWSPDSKWLAWSAEAKNLFAQISIYSIEANTIRAKSVGPASARPVLRQAVEGLRTCAEERIAISVPARRRTSS
jgi:tricorn protease